MRGTRDKFAVLGLIVLSAPFGAIGCSTFHDECTNGLCSTFKDGGGGGAASTGSDMSAGGTGGRMASSSAGGTGGGVATSSAIAASSSGASSSSGGGDCMVQGTCETKTIYVGLDIADMLCTTGATTALVTDDPSQITGGLVQVKQFKAFKDPLPNTIPLNYCKTGGGGSKNNATLGTALPCQPGAQGYRVLGYVATKAVTAGYQQLKNLTAGAGNNAIVVDDGVDDNVCCHASCTLLNGFVPP